MSALLKRLEIIQVQALLAKDAVMKIGAAGDPETTEQRIDSVHDILEYLEYQVKQARETAERTIPR
jgi:hypothetical protein